MSAGPIILDYELTKEQLITESRTDVAQSRKTWWLLSLLQFHVAEFGVAAEEQISVLGV
jgi:hypothetical protein